LLEPVGDGRPRGMIAEPRKGGTEPGLSAGFPILLILAGAAKSPFFAKLPSVDDNVVFIRSQPKRRSSRRAFGGRTVRIYEKRKSDNAKKTHLDCCFLRTYGLCSACKANECNWR
jgi:hypothetical protein